MPIKLAIIEDNVELLESMKEYFSSNNQFEIVQLAKSMEEFLQNPAVEYPDIILLDLVLPEMSGVDGIPLIREL